ncbi:MAG: hypothetical protein J5I92_07480 [Thiogranum sp.]|nr:hypothetical protein [Thiogranum sp.]
MDGQGNAVVIWEQDDDTSLSQRFLSELRNGLWINPDSRTDFIGPGANLDSGSVAMNSQGDAVIASTYGFSVFLSEFRNGIWNHPASDNDRINFGTSDYPRRPALVMDDLGNALVLWGQDEGLFLSEYRNTMWTHPASVLDTFNPGGGAVGNYSVAMDDLGNALVAWTRKGNSNEDRLLISEFRNGIWSKPASLAESINPAGSAIYGNLKVAMDNQGNALVAWLQNDANGDRQLFLSEYRSGSWTHPGSLADNISPDGSYVVAFDMATDNLGNALITWFEPIDLNMQAYTMKVFRSEYRNNAWIHPAGLADYVSDPNGNGESPSVAMNDQGKALLTWLQYESDARTRYLYVSEYVNGAWSAARAIPDTFGVNPRYRIAMNGQGKYVLAWTRVDTNGTQRFDPSTNQVFATRSQ